MCLFNLLIHPKKNCSGVCRNCQAGIRYHLQKGKKISLKQICLWHCACLFSLNSGFVLSSPLSLSLSLSLLSPLSLTHPLHFRFQRSNENSAGVGQKGNLDAVFHYALRSYPGQIKQAWGEFFPPFYGLRTNQFASRELLQGKEREVYSLYTTKK